MRRKLDAIAAKADPSKIMDLDGPVTTERIVEGIAKSRFRPAGIAAAAKLYAVAILESGLSGRVDWEEIGKAAVAKWGFPGLDMLKARAWAEIKKASKVKTAAASKAASKPGRPDPAEDIPPGFRAPGWPYRRARMILLIGLGAGIAAGVLTALWSGLP